MPLDRETRRRLQHDLQQAARRAIGRVVRRDGLGLCPLPIAALGVDQHEILAFCFVQTGCTLSKLTISSLQEGIKLALLDMFKTLELDGPMRAPQNWNRNEGPGEVVGGTAGQALFLINACRTTKVQFKLSARVSSSSTTPRVLASSIYKVADRKTAAVRRSWLGC